MTIKLPTRLGGYTLTKKERLMIVRNMIAQKERLVNRVGQSITEVKITHFERTGIKTECVLIREGNIFKMHSAPTLQPALM